MAIFSLKDKLSRTRQNLSEGLNTIFSKFKSQDEEMWESLEELLIGADVGIDTSLEVVEELRTAAMKGRISDEPALFAALKEALKARMLPAAGLDMPGGRPDVIMFVGVNGTGKTTSIAKMAEMLKAQGQEVMLVAGDTYRAAAIEQLEKWGDRLGVNVFKHQRGSDPASVVFDSLGAAKAKGVDTVIVDTAGRLHTQINLMEELKKIKRVMGKQIEAAPNETLMVIDATTGQNGISQARLFNESVGLSGIFLSKLDGTAKGGIVIPIEKELELPVKFIGMGERPDEIVPFEPDAFLDALIETHDS